MRLFSTFLILLFMMFPASAQKRIALTFDDAPRADSAVFSGLERAEVLIAALASEDAGAAAFFVTTKGFERDRQGRARIAQYAQAGHLIANHSHAHNWARQTQADEYLADIDRAQEMLGGFENLRPWYRYPFLDEGRDAEKIAALVQGLEERGLSNGYVTVDNYDWHIEQRLQQALKAGQSVNFDALGKAYVQLLLYSAEYYDSLAVQTLGQSPVHVLLLHENDVAALYVDDLIRAFRASGWEIVSPDDAYSDPLPAPQSTNTGQGRIVGLAADAGRPNSTMWSWTIDEEMIDLRLARMNVFTDPDGLDECPAPPAMPEPLGAGTVSLDDRYEFGQTITADCQDLFIGVEHGVWQSVEHYRRSGEGWTHIRRIAGSEELSANDPYVTQDGERLYYIHHEGENTEIVYLNRTGLSSWSNPVFLPAPVNTPAHEFYISFDVNGDLIFSSDRGRGDYSLYRAVIEGEAFTTVEPFPEGINTRGYEADPFMSPDGSYLLFASSRHGGKGRGDIYIAFRQDDGWTDPVAVAEINTENHELCPFVGADGRTLYFTSDEDLYTVSTAILEAYRP